MIISLFFYHTIESKHDNFKLDVATASDITPMGFSLVHWRHVLDYSGWSDSWFGEEQGFINAAARSIDIWYDPRESISCGELWRKEAVPRFERYYLNNFTFMPLNSSLVLDAKMKGRILHDVLVEFEDTFTHHEAVCYMEKDLKRCRELAAPLWDALGRTKCTPIGRIKAFLQQDISWSGHEPENSWFAQKDHRSSSYVRGQGGGGSKGVTQRFVFYQVVKMIEHRAAHAVNMLEEKFKHSKIRLPSMKRVCTNEGIFNRSKCQLWPRKVQDEHWSSKSEKLKQQVRAHGYDVSRRLFGGGYRIGNKRLSEFEFWEGYNIDKALQEVAEPRSSCIKFNQKLWGEAGNFPKGRRAKAMGNSGLPTTISSTALSHNNLSCKRDLATKLLDLDGKYVLKLIWRLSVTEGALLGNDTPQRIVSDRQDALTCMYAYVDYLVTGDAFASGSDALLRLSCQPHFRAIQNLLQVPALHHDNTVPHILANGRGFNLLTCISPDKIKLVRRVVLDARKSKGKGYLYKKNLEKMGKVVSDHHCV